MEVSVISEENIKPSLTVNNYQPFKLSLLDQLTPRYYSPIVFFYPFNGTCTKKITNQLKGSLSKTLDLFYPLSGRVQDNLFIYNFNEGASFIEARVKGQLLDFLRDPQLELLNKLLPYQPLCVITDQSLPQIGVQVNIFDCGGTAIGVSFFHKIADAKTGSDFFKNWAANTTGSYEKVTQPNLFEASLMLPPIEPPLPYDNSSERWLSKNERLSIRRFLFDGNAIASLRLKSKSEVVKNPSPFQALSAFLWKSKMEASKRVHKSGKPSMLIQVKEIRGVTKPPLSSHAIGNLYMHGATGVVETEMELSDLVALMKEALDSINFNSLKRTTILEHLKATAENSIENIDVFSVNSLSGFSFEDLDFGWGKPIWTGLFGETSKTHCSVSNLANIKRIDGRKSAMEAWVTLDKEIMAALENDPEFIAFATPNPPIISTEYKHSRL